MNASFFGPPTTSTIEYLKQRHEVEQTPAFGAAKSRFKAEGAAIFEMMLGDEALTRINIAINKAAAITRPDVISRMMNLEDLQGARPVMQAMIMANPVVRKAFHKGFCHGYEGSYKDEQPGVIGAGHKHYDIAMQGTFEHTPEGFSFVNSSNGFDNHGNATLNKLEWVDVRCTWRLAEKMMKQGDKDPTNPFGGSL
jgi:hypothetical protein